MKKNKDIKVGVIGLWHLGCVYSACLAKLGYDVVGFDFDKKVVAKLQKGIPPVSEPRLNETIDKYLNKNLRFSVKEEDVCEDKDYIFITFDLPVNVKDEVSTQLMNQAYEMILKFYSSKSIVVISSQVPLGTCRKLIDLVKEKLNKKVKVIYFPENLRLGKAFDSFLKADRIILGSDEEKINQRFIKDFSGIDCPKLTMGLESAEMVKHALNSYLATCISYSSEMGDLCELLGANMIDVVKAVKTDRRVSFLAPISPGLGFAGGTLGRDLKSLMRLGFGKQYKTKLANAVYLVNQDRLKWLVKKINMFYPNLKNKNIGILGLTYKPDTDTLRRSMSLELAVLLNKKGVRIKALDPAIRNSIDNYPFISVCQNSNEFFENLDLTILMTEWQDFLELSVKKNFSLMKKKIIIDTKNFLDPKRFLREGFVYCGTGYSL